MQRFFRGGVFLDEKGTVETILPASGKKISPFSVIKLEDEPTKCPQSIRHHICWILPEALGSSQRLLDFMFEAHRIPYVQQQQKALQALTLETASFQVALKWEGVGRKVLRCRAACLKAELGYWLVSILVWSIMPSLPCRKQEQRDTSLLLFTVSLELSARLLALPLFQPIHSADCPLKRSMP